MKFEKNTYSFGSSYAVIVDDKVIGLVTKVGTNIWVAKGDDSVGFGQTRKAAALELLDEIKRVGAENGK